MHSTHYNYGYMAKDHSDSEKGNLLPLFHGLFFPINRKRYFICTNPQTGLCYTSYGVVDIAQWVLHQGSIRRPIAP